MSDSSNPLDVIRAQLAKLEAGPGIAKAAAPSLRDRARSETHAAFVAAVDHLVVQPGWSLSRIADAMGVDKTTLSDWCRYGDESRKQIPGWVFSALPREAHAVFLRHMLGWSDAPALARVG